MSRWQSDQDATPTVVRRVLREDYAALLAACEVDILLSGWIAEAYRLFCADEREVRRFMPRDKQPVCSAATVAKYRVLQWARLDRRVDSAKAAVSFGMGRLLAMAVGGQLRKSHNWPDLKGSQYVQSAMVYGPAFCGEVNLRGLTLEAST